MTFVCSFWVIIVVVTSCAWLRSFLSIGLLHRAFGRIGLGQRLLVERCMRSILVPMMLPLPFGPRRLLGWSPKAGRATMMAARQAFPQSE
jgi:hypothetical protein